MSDLRVFVSEAFLETFYRELENYTTRIDDSNWLGSPEGGRVWLRLEDGREIVLNYKVEVKEPSQDAQTEIM